MLLANWEFDGPIYESADLDSKPGVYVLLSTTGSEMEILSIGIAETDISSEIRSMELWRERADRNLYAYVFYAENNETDNLAEIKRQLIQEYLS